MLKRRQVNLLKDLGTNETSYKNLEAATQFYHTIMYSGKMNETITDTRVRMYEKQKVKSSMHLISDESSTQHHILRADLQTFIWRQCLSQHMVIPVIDGTRGWCVNKDIVVPVWYRTTQLPPSLIRSKTKRSNFTAQEDVPQLKKRKTCDQERLEINVDHASRDENADRQKEEEQFGDISSLSSTESDSDSDSSDSEKWEESDWESDWESERTDSDDPDW